MANETHHPSNHLPQQEDRSAAEQNRLQAIGDRQQAAELVFRELAQSPDVFGYWRARAKVDGFWELALMRRDLAAQSSAPRLSEAWQTLDGILPFDQAELDQLVEQMKEHEVPGFPELADRWYSELDMSSETAKLVQHWSEWIDTNFPPSPQQPTAEGAALLSMLQGMSDEIVEVI